MDKVITCIDGSVFAEDVCNAGIWAAQRLQKPVMFLHAIEKKNQTQTEDLSGAIGLGARSTLLAQMTELDEKHSKLALKIGKEMLTIAAQRAEKHGCETVEQVQRHGNITETIIDLEGQARLLVLGRSGESHGQTFKALGSHIEQIIRQVHTPVLIANKNFVAPKSFMLAYDARSTADKAVARIIQGGLLRGLTCHLVSIKNAHDNQQDKFAATQTLLQKHGFDVQASYLEGPVFDTLMTYKNQHTVDMVVMGAFSHSQLYQVFLGSNSLRMMENTHLPMVVLR